MSQILIHQLSLILPNNKILFDKLNLAFDHHKIGLVGRNGAGKSSLLKLIIGEMEPASGSINAEGKLAYVPQNPVIPGSLTIGGLFDVEEKIKALERIINGSLEVHDFELLNEDWHVAERLQQQLAVFGMQNFHHDRLFTTLSGGEITKLLLTKAFFSDVDFLLLDEPTNHLDYKARKQLYHLIQSWQGGLIVSSHDRTLLNFMEEIIELNAHGVAIFGGNYQDYVKQKTLERTANELQLHNAKKLLQKSKQSIQSSREKHEQKQSYGKHLRKSGKIDKMGANSKQGRSERSQNKMLIKEQRLIKQAETNLQNARDKIEIINDIHVALPKTRVPNGKMILEIENLCFSYPHSKSIFDNFNLTLQGPERIALVGENGSGKTTLINLILGSLLPNFGEIRLGIEAVSYLDQNASLLNPNLTVLENFLMLNPLTKEHDAHQSLAAFLFKNVASQKLAKHLSGGEKLRALLSCVLMSTYPPQLLILDEPTNHLDLASIESIESALTNYEGAMIVVSHDLVFLEKIGIEKIINM